MLIRPLAVRSCALIVAALLSGCGGGGGGGDDTPGTASVPPGSFGVIAGPKGGQIGGLNLPVTLSFTKAVDPATATIATIKVVSVADASGTSTAPPGHLASVIITVNGSQVVITPEVEFKRDQVEYGFLANAL